MIKAILYDLGDIFFEAHEWRKWNYEKLKQRKLFKGSFTDFYFLYESFLSRTYENKATYDSCFNAFLEHLKVEDADAFKTISYNHKKKLEDERILYPGVKDTLAILAQKGINNIVVTDNEQTDMAIRQTILQRFHIDAEISRVFSSKDLGTTKNHSSFFRKVLIETGHKNNEVVFVAHDEDEITSAKAANIRTVEFNNYLNVPTHADYTITTFKELPTLVNNL